MKIINLFSPNTHPDVVVTILEDLQLKLMPQDRKYLGLPLFMGKDKARNYALVKERVDSKVAGWKAKVLSQAG